MITERLEAADVAQIYKLWNEYADAYNSENLELLNALWSNDSIQLPPDAPPQLGKEQIQKLEQVWSDQYHLEISINPEVIRILGDQAYTYGSFRFIMTQNDGEDKTITQRKGKFLAVLAKETDESWKILIDCFNYDEAGGEVLI